MVHASPFFADCSIFSPKLRGIFATILRLDVMRSNMFTEYKGIFFLSCEGGGGRHQDFFVKTGCK